METPSNPPSPKVKATSAPAAAPRKGGKGPRAVSRKNLQPAAPTPPPASAAIATPEEREGGIPTDAARRLGLETVPLPPPPLVASSRQKERDKEAAGPKPQYFNRELSWLAFNRRVLEQAENPRYPVLERMRFLSFVSSNLDEFFEIRVAGLLQQRESGTREIGPDNMLPRDQLKKIQELTNELVEDQYSCWLKNIVPELKRKDVVFKTRSELTTEEMEWLTRYFEDEVYPVLTPLAFDPAHPFPQIGNKELNILVWVDDPETREEEFLLAIVPVPRILPRVVRIELPDQKETYIFQGEIVKIFAARLFSGYDVRGAWAFRITRNSDLYIDEEEVKNLLHKIEEELVNRQKGAAVRLEIEEGVNPAHLERLIHQTRLPKDFVYLINGPINLLRLFSVYDVIDRPDLKFRNTQPFTPVPFRRPKSIFTAVAEQDYLLHHPYESFDPVVDFILEAAGDPMVFAIKQTLYRTSGDSPITKALIAASKNGKQVTVLVELKARFDEANNILWAKALEEAGVHVVYGIVGLKTHCKCTLVVRREPAGLRLYSHLGTGNYNPKTARTYTDFSFFTAREDITAEVAQVFNVLTGFARKPDFGKLWVSPFNLHSNVMAAIEKEMRHAREGKPASMIIKVNSLIDKPVIDKLYEASQAGVQVDMIIRGICGLVPGVPGLSENIRVRSLLGRYLEHSRVYYFENHGSEPTLMLGSADWMQRNFYRRIECVFPIEDPALRKRIIEEILPAYMKDKTFGRFLQPDGTYAPMKPGPGEKNFSVQVYFETLAEELRVKHEKAAQE
jgi:polyphosphate kinase